VREPPTARSIYTEGRLHECELHLPVKQLLVISLSLFAYTSVAMMNRKLAGSLHVDSSEGYCISVKEPPGQAHGESQASTFPGL